MATTDKPPLEPLADVPDKPEPTRPEQKDRGHSKLYWLIFAAIISNVSCRRPP